MSEWIKKLTEKYSEVNENQKASLAKKLAKASASSEKGKAAVTLPKAPFQIPEDVPVDERDMFMAKAAAAHKAGKTHFTMPGGKKHAVTMKKDTADAVNKESTDLNKDNADKAIRHDCATHVEHAEWGEGHPISEMHTIVETAPGEGYVSHYDVMFEHGIEKNVAVEDLTILAEMSHGHSRKKKNEMSSKEKMKRGLYNGAKDEVEMNPKKKKDKASDMNNDQMEGTLPPVYARILENRAAHYKGAHEGSPAGEGMSPSAKKAKADMEAGASYDDTEEKGHDDVSKAGRAGPRAKARANDNMKGDKSVINPPKDVTKGGQG